MPLKIMPWPMLPATRTSLMCDFRTVRGHFHASPRAQVCGDAMVVPTACVDLEKIVPAPAYQVSRICFRRTFALLFCC
jgi:hypothetical protein